MSACIQCKRTADELGANRVAEFAQLLTRPRPYPAKGTYQICLGCALEVKKQQDERARLADEQAERAGV